ncbi:hypothetical protein BDFB_009948, partial [Asbolus verrucosus]
TNLSLQRLYNIESTFIIARGASIPDHIFVSEELLPLLNPHSSIGTIVTSDHLPLVSNFTLNSPSPSSKHIIIFDYKHTEWTKFKQTTTDTLPPILPTDNTETINRQTDSFTSAIITVKERHIQTKTIPTDKRPTRIHILNQIREKRRICRLFFCFLDPLLKTKFNRLNAKTRRDLNKIREEQWTETYQNLNYRNHKKFWNKFRSITGQKSISIHLLIHNNSVIATPLEKPNCFALTLSKIHRVPNDPNFDDNF